MAGGLATMPFGSPQISVRPTAAVGEIDAHEVQRRGGDAAPDERPRVPLAPRAVVEEPRGALREHRVPAVGLARERPVPRRKPSSSASVRPSHSTRNRCWSRRRRRRRRRQLTAARSTAPATCSRAVISSPSGSSTSSSAEASPCLVRYPTRQRTRRSPSARGGRRGGSRSCCTGGRGGSSACARISQVGGEPVDVAPEHDVERAVRVRGDAARPRLAAGEIGRAPTTSSVTGSIALDPARSRPVRPCDASRYTSPGSRSTTIVATGARRGHDLECSPAPDRRARSRSRGRSVRRGPPSSPGQRLGQYPCASESIGIG